MVGTIYLIWYGCHVYVGSTIQSPPNKRWYRHVNELKRGVHHNKALQNISNKHGAEALRFEIWEQEIPVEDLWSWEKASMEYWGEARGLNLLNEAAWPSGYESGGAGEAGRKGGKIGGKRAAENMTPEQRSERSRNIWKNIPAERRHEIAVKAANTGTPQERKERAALGAHAANASMSSEKKRQRITNMYTSMTSEQRSDKSRKSNATLGPQRRQEIALKRWETRRKKADQS